MLVMTGRVVAGTFRRHQSHAPSQEALMNGTTFKTLDGRTRVIAPETLEFFAREIGRAHV